MQNSWRGERNVDQREIKQGERGSEGEREREKVKEREKVSVYLCWYFTVSCASSLEINKQEAEVVKQTVFCFVLCLIHFDFLHQIANDEISREPEELFDDDRGGEGILISQ